MTIGDKIWADAIRATGIWTLVRDDETAQWRAFAIKVIELINESHGIIEEKPPAELPNPLVIPGICSVNTATMTLNAAKAIIAALLTERRVS